MNLTLRGKILISRILLISSCLLTIIFLLLAPVFRISWTEEEFSTEFNLYVEYSTFEYLFKDEVEVHFDVSGNESEHLEYLLGTQTIKFQEIKNYKDSTSSLVSSIFMLFVLLLIIILSKSKFRKEPLSSNGKDPYIEKIKFKLYRKDALNLFDYCSVGLAIPLFIFLDIHNTSYNFFCELTNTAKSHNLFANFIVLNKPWFIGILIVVIILAAVDSFIITPAITDEIKKHNITEKEELISMPYIGATADYVSIKNTSDNSAEASEENENDEAPPVQ